MDRDVVTMRQCVVGAFLSCVVLIGCEGAPDVLQTRSSSSSLWNEDRVRPQILSAEIYSSEADAEQTARAFLSSRAKEFHLDGQGLTLRLATTRVGLSGTYLRFAQDQKVGGEVLPVFGAEVIVLVHDDGQTRTVQAVNFEHQDDAWKVTSGSDIGLVAATTAARAAVQAVTLSDEPSATRGIYVSAAGPQVAWRVMLPMTEAKPPHDWTVYVDAATGHELGRHDGVHYASDGTAMVYDMNPVASTGNTSFVDGNDAVTPALDAARVQVPLHRLDGSGFTRGTYVDVTTKTASARANSNTNTFNFSRNSLGFEQANVYYHLDRTQMRIQALGFTNINNRVQGVTVDAQADDNSFYTDSTTRLSFGTGGVDDAEDADIVSHEYGHSIQGNQVPNFGNGDEGAMGEGFGDYLAASFSLTLGTAAGHPQLSDPACIGDWDGVSYSTTTPKCLRRVDGTKHYPEAEVGEVHDDGEMWSAGLWRIHEQLGADVTDKLVLEAHFLLGTNATFFTASQALVSADRTSNGGVNEAVIRRSMIVQGLSRTLSTPVPMGPVTSMPITLRPTRTTAGNYANNADDVKTARFPGATGLIVHFTRIGLDTKNTCLQQHCDNLYLTNGDGDLFQVLGGTAQNVTSVAIAGDTVNIRLVSDSSTVGVGYDVDRIDVLGMTDGGIIVVDAGTPDAGRPDAGRIDAGFDGGNLGVDSGIPDAGGSDSGTPDSGFEMIDAGQTDGGPALTDGGVDGGPIYGPKTLPALGNETLRPAAAAKGCGCGATPGLEGFALLGLFAARRRRVTGRMISQKLRL